MPFARNSTIADLHTKTAGGLSPAVFFFDQALFRFAATPGEGSCADQRRSEKRKGRRKRNGRNGQVVHDDVRSHARRGQTGENVSDFRSAARADGEGVDSDPVEQHEGRRGAVDDEARAVFFFSVERADQRYGQTIAPHSREIAACECEWSRRGDRCGLSERRVGGGRLRYRSGLQAANPVGRDLD